METPDFDKSKFAANFQKLLDHSIKIMRMWGERKMINQKNPILTSLLIYSSCYSNEDDILSFVNDIRSTLREYSKEILAPERSDSWIRNNKVMYTYVAPNGKKSIFALTGVYEAAYQLCEKAKKDTEGLPEAAQKEYPELNFTNAFMLYLYRLFRSSSNNSEVNKSLNIIIAEIENELGIQGTSQPSGFEGLLGMAGGLLQNMGIGANTNNSNGSAPNGQNIMEYLGNLIKDENMQKNIGQTINNAVNTIATPEIRKKIEGAKDPGEVLNGVAEIFTNPETKRRIGNTMNEVANHITNKSSTSSSSTTASGQSSSPALTNGESGQGNADGKSAELQE